MGRIAASSQTDDGWQDPPSVEAAPGELGVFGPMKHQATRDLYSYWQHLRHGRAAPERSEIEPADIRHLLGNTFILEVVSTTEYRYRLAGTRLCALYGREMKGKDFNSFWTPKDRDAVLTMLNAICEDAAATVVGVEATTDHGRKLPMECLLLPLRQSGEGFTRLLGSLVPMDDPYWIGIHPVMTQAVTSLRLIWPDEAPSGLIHSSALAADVALFQKSTPEPIPSRRRVHHLTVYDGGKA